jgi:putative phage-type endonuclease
MIHNCQQGTDEWLKIRLGKFTASKAQAIATNGKGLDTLVFEKAEEIITGQFKQGYKNADMERGNELESRARNLYELETGNVVNEVGFVELSEYVGCSPDGLVGNDGLFETKCPSFRVYYEFLTTGVINTGYMWQMQMQMLVTDRKWCDYVVYNPVFKSQPIIIKRVERDEKSINKLEVGLQTAQAKLKDILERIK